jgi:hypothetical protein
MELARAGDGREEYEDGSLISELDLFVAGTNVAGNHYTLFDDAGHLIYDTDHRAVFLLKYRSDHEHDAAGAAKPARKNNFAPEDGEDPAIVCQALAKLAHLTSCFPGAFTPVLVRSKAERCPIDDKLRMWGKLSDDKAYFLDGGILDNKPFTYTLRTIFTRLSRPDVERKLFYIEPDPRRAQEHREATQPKFHQALQQALIGIRGHESIIDDLRRLNEHNSTLQRYRRFIEGIWSDAITPPNQSTLDLYERALLVNMSERTISGIFMTDGQPDRITSPDEEASAKKLIAFFDSLQRNDRIDAIDLRDEFDVDYRLRRLYHVMYLLHDLLYKPKGEIRDKRLLQAYRGGDMLDEDHVKHYDALLVTINAHIQRYEILGWAIEELINNTKIDWRTKEPRAVWDDVVRALRHMLVVDGGSDQPVVRDDDREWRDRLERWHSTLTARRDRIVRLLKQGEPGRVAVGAARTLLRQLDEADTAAVTGTLTDTNDPIRVAFERYSELDAYLFPVEELSGLREKDEIEIIRISPHDARIGFSARSLDDKISGDIVRHYGGFFKSSWRSNDVLWGRLDGVCQLVETLLDRDRVATLIASSRRAALRKRFFTNHDVLDDAGAYACTCIDSRCEFNPALCPERLFARSGTRVQATLKQWLWELLCDTPAGALDQGVFQARVELLIEAAQLEIIACELPNVIDDALAEQAGWNRRAVADERRKSDGAGTSGSPPEFEDEPDATPSDGQPLPWQWRASRLTLDSLTTTVSHATKRLEEIDRLTAASPAPTPKDTTMGKFFHDKYKVGAESLSRDVPTLVLLQIIATAMLVLRNCLLGVFDPSAIRRVKRNPLYRYGLDAPLRAFHSMVLLARGAPEAVFTAFLGVMVLCVLALIVGVIWWDGIVQHPADGFQPIGFIIFIAAPVLLLLLQIRLLAWDVFWGGWDITTRRVRIARLALFLGLPAACLILFIVGLSQFDEIVTGTDNLSVDIQRLAGLIVIPMVLFFFHMRVVRWIDRLVTPSIQARRRKKRE